MPSINQKKPSKRSLDGAERLHVKNQAIISDVEVYNEIVEEEFRMPKDLRIEYNSYDENFAKVETINFSYTREHTHFIEQPSIIELDKPLVGDHLAMKRSKSVISLLTLGSAHDDDTDTDNRPPKNIPKSQITAPNKAVFTRRTQNYDIDFEEDLEKDLESKLEGTSSSYTEEFELPQFEMKVEEEKGVTRKHLQFIANFRELPTLEEWLSPRGYVSENEDFFTEDMEGDEAEEASDIQLGEDDGEYSSDLAKYRQIQKAFPADFTDIEMDDEKEELPEEEEDKTKEYEDIFKSESESGSEEESGGSEVEDVALNFDKFDEAFDDLDGKTKVDGKKQGTAQEEPLSGLLTAVKVGDTRGSVETTVDMEEQRRQLAQQQMETYVKTFVDNLINYCAKMSEKYSEQNWLRANLNKPKIIKELLSVFNELNSEKIKSEFLARKCVDYYKRAKCYSYFWENTKTMNAEMERYRENLNRLDLILRKKSEIRHHLRETMAQLDAELVNATALYNNASQHFADLMHKTFDTSRLPKLEMLVKNSIEKMKSIHNNLSEDRLKIIIKLHSVAGLQMKLQKLETLSDKVDMKSFMSMETEALSLEKKLEDRGWELIKLQDNNQHKIAMLCHLKEKEQMCLAEQDRKLVEFEQIFIVQQKLRQKFYNLKKERNEIHGEMRNLSMRCGLLDKPNMIADYDRTMQQIEQKSAINNKLRWQLNRMNRYLKLYEKRSQSQTMSIRESLRYSLYPNSIASNTLKSFTINSRASSRLPSQQFSDTYSQSLIDLVNPQSVVQTNTNYPGTSRNNSIKF